MLPIICSLAAGGPNSTQLFGVGRLLKDVFSAKRFPSDFHQALVRHIKRP